MKQINRTHLLYKEGILSWLLLQVVFSKLEEVSAGTGVLHELAVCLSFTDRWEEFLVKYLIRFGPIGVLLWSHEQIGFKPTALGTITTLLRFLIKIFLYFRYKQKKCATKLSARFNCVMDTP